MDGRLVNKTKSTIPYLIPSPTKNIRYVTQEFATEGLGHKFTELLMALNFTNANKLQYIFNEASFLENHRTDDLHWLSNLLKKRYPVPNELDDKKDGMWTIEQDQWLHLTNYLGTTEENYLHEIEKRSEGDAGSRAADIKEIDTSRLVGLFAGTRNVQDILQLTRRVEQDGNTLEENKTEEELIDRLAIHIRLGDIQSLQSAEMYLKVIHGLRTRLQILLPFNEVHMVYYIHEEDASTNKECLDQLRRGLPEEVQYHNLEGTEDTIRFLVGSKYLMTSGSSLSYLAAYLCPRCHVIYDMPKEYALNGVSMTEENYYKTFYYMDEW
ncbi:hypothetical protein BGX28_010504, partial [Mortierella sp. GBA30]